MSVRRERNRKAEFIRGLRDDVERLGVGTIIGNHNFNRTRHPSLHGKRRQTVA